MIGILSDSHDNVFMIKSAVSLFLNAGCRLIVHAGDVVAPFAARELAAAELPIKAVFGNCDGEKAGLTEAFRPFGEIVEAPLVFTLEGLRFLICHYHFSVQAYMESGKYDVVVFGHTHKPGFRRNQNALIINPGETGGWVSGKSTVALLNPKTLEAEIVSL